MSLSIVLTAHNDGDVKNTVASIRATAGNAVEIIIVDDASVVPVNISGEKVIRTAQRIGVGPARTLGVLSATCEWVMIGDAHLRFTPGWYELAMPRIAARPTTLYTATCLGLDSDHMNLDQPKGVYSGGTLNVMSRDRNNHSKMQVLEAIWKEGNVADDEEIPCCLGASYFINREFFLKLSPLRHLRRWGDDETMLSVKTWLAGGDVRLLKPVRIGHKFRLNNERVPFLINVNDLMCNKLFMALTLTKEPLTSKLVKQLRRERGCAYAKKFYEENWGIIEIERKLNSQIFVRDFSWLCERFKLPVP